MTSFRAGGLLIVALSLAACADRAAFVGTDGGGAAGILIGRDGGSGGTGGMNGGDDGGLDGGVSEGACDNPSDIEAIEGANEPLRDIANSCGMVDCRSTGLEEFEACVSDCIRISVDNLSEECAGCFGSFARCGRNLCDFLCQLNNTCGPQCLFCLNTAECLTDLEECTGIPDVCDEGDAGP